MKKCSIDGCGKKHHSRGWCHMHYTRWLKYGDTGTVATTKRPRVPARSCEVSGCDRKHHAKGRCHRHYRTPAVPPAPPAPPGPDDACRDCGGTVDTGGLRCRPCMMADLHRRLDAKPIANPKYGSGDPGRIAVRQISVPSRNMRAA